MSNNSNMWIFPRFPKYTDRETWDSIKNLIDINVEKYNNIISVEEESDCYNISYIPVEARMLFYNLGEYIKKEYEGSYYHLVIQGMEFEGSDYRNGSCNVM